MTVSPVSPLTNMAKTEPRRPLTLRDNGIYNDSLNGYTLSQNYSIINGTYKEKNVADAEWDKDTRIIILWVQIILGFIGGFAVCGWLWYNRKRKSRVNVVMLHVTLSDLLVMVTTLTQVIWEMVDRWWLAGDALCRIIKFYQSFSMMASSYMLVLLSIDRHQAIRSPLRDPPAVSNTIINIHACYWR